MKFLVFTLPFLVLFATIPAFADDFKFQSKCEGTSLVLTVTDLDDNSLQYVTVRTVSGITGNDGFYKKFITDEAGIVTITDEDNTGYVWVQKPGYNDQKMSVECKQVDSIPDDTVSTFEYASTSEEILGWYDLDNLTATTLVGCDEYLDIYELVGEQNFWDLYPNSTVATMTFLKTCLHLYNSGTWFYYGEDVFNVTKKSITQYLSHEFDFSEGIKNKEAVILSGNPLLERVEELEASYDYIETLKAENSELKAQIEEKNKRIDDLLIIIQEQIKVIMEWITNR